jgi:uridine kinase
VVDGVFLLRPELGRCWDVRVFVDVDPEQGLERGVERDLTLDAPEARAVRRARRLRVYRERYLPADTAYLRDVDPMALADAVVDNRDPAAPGLRLRGTTGGWPTRSPRSAS